MFFGIIWVLAQILRLLYHIGNLKGLENLPRNGVFALPEPCDLDPVLIGICLPINYRCISWRREGYSQEPLVRPHPPRAGGRFQSTAKGADIKRSGPR